MTSSSLVTLSSNILSSFSPPIEVADRRHVSSDGRLREGGVASVPDLDLAVLMGGCEQKGVVAVPLQRKGGRELVCVCVSVYVSALYVSMCECVVAE